MTQEDKDLLLKDLCARLSYKTIILFNNKHKFTLNQMNPYQYAGKDGYGVIFDFGGKVYSVEDCKPYLRPMSSMTEEERLELLEVVVGKDAIKYFQVLIDGSIDNTDAAYQDLQHFTMHWVNFDGINTASYLDWLNAHHFDYRGLIEKNLAIAVTEENNPYKG